MNYAVIKSGGKQYKVSTGDVILIEKMLGDKGSRITFDEVVMMGEGKTIHTEEPALKTATVTGEVIEQTKGPKIIVFKKKRRHNYRRKQGHKQDLTAVRIKSIDLKKITPETKQKEKKENKKVTKSITKTTSKNATKKAASKKE